MHTVQSSSGLCALYTCLHWAKSLGNTNCLTVMLGPKKDDIALALSATVRNREDISFTSYIRKEISRTFSVHHRTITRIRITLSQGDAEKLVHAFVTSTLVYCNSLLIGCPNNPLKSLQLSEPS